MSRLIESIRLLDGRWFNLTYHQHRIDDSLLEMFGGKPSWRLEMILGEQETSDKGLYKCRLVYDSEVVSSEIVPYTIRPVKSLRLIESNEIRYDHKFEDRTLLEDLFERRGTSDDVLIIRNGLVTDTSYANILFLKANQWVTPASFLLNGTMRRSLLDAGTIREAQIRVDDIHQYEKFRLMNALMGLNAPESDVSNIN